MTCLTKGCQNVELTKGCQSVGLTIDLSLIFNENGYINESDCNKYSHNNSVTHIILIQSNDSPIKIGNGFLFGCVNLISIDISKIVNVIAIGDHFLCYCTNLKNFDATKLTKVVMIGDYFLSYCHNLTIFDTTGLTKITRIGINFLVGCNKNLTITIKNPSNRLRNKLSKTNYIITQLYNRPIIHLVNKCVI